MIYYYNPPPNMVDSTYYTNIGLFP